ncbi:MAG: rhomboid family intramembrane serine protease [Elusimicrobiota bacterium]
MNRRGLVEPVVITPDMLEDGGRETFRLDFEQGMSVFPKFTASLILANVLVFVWEVLRGALWSQKVMIASGAMFRPALLSGEYWRLFTPMFLHADWGHLVGNCLALYILGIAAEHAFGPALMAGIYVFAGLTCFMASAAVHERVVAVGASGAIFGLLAGVIVYMVLHRDVLVMRSRRLGVVLAVWSIYMIGQGFRVPYVDNAGHIGGFLGGLVCTWWMRPKIRIGRQV